MEKSFVEVVDKHAPKKRKILCGNHKPHVNKTLDSAKKRKILRGNHKPHVNKTLHSVIMKCSQLKIKAMKSKSKKMMKLNVKSSAI